jgi:hypothetical protein
MKCFLKMSRQSLLPCDGFEPTGILSCKSDGSWPIFWAGHQPFSVSTTWTTHLKRRVARPVFRKVPLALPETADRSNLIVGAFTPLATERQRDPLFGATGPSSRVHSMRSMYGPHRSGGSVVRSSLSPHEHRFSEFPQSYRFSHLPQSGEKSG